MSPKESTVRKDLYEEVALDPKHKEQRIKRTSYVKVRNL